MWRLEQCCMPVISAFRFQRKKCFIPAHSRIFSIVGNLCNREVACSASDRQGCNIESCIWRASSSDSFQHPQEVLLTQFSLYVHKCGLMPHSFHFQFILLGMCDMWVVDLTCTYCVSSPWSWKVLNCHFVKRQFNPKGTVYTSHIYKSEHT